MHYPSWRQSLVRSLHLHRSKPVARYFQIASISSSNKVKNRTMVFRGFVEESLDLLAITDSRSEKIKDWSSHPHSEICWYFAKTKEQYRIAVNVQLYQENENELREKVWGELSTNAKSQFYWPNPKAPFDDTNIQAFNMDDIKQNKIESDSEGNEIPSNFVVVRFKPTNVDYLNLSHTPQTREIHSLEGKQWNCEKVNP